MENLLLSRTRAQQVKDLRAGLMVQLYPTKPIGTAGAQSNLLLSDLLSSFKRFSGNQQTAYENDSRHFSGNQQTAYTKGSVQTSVTSASNPLEQQVERAIIKVLGCAPGRGTTNFFGALNAAFPATEGGDLAILPAQSQMMLYGANDNSGYGKGAYGNGKELLAELSTRQAALFRQTSIIMADAVQIVEGLSSFVPKSDQERVEALRSLIASQSKALVEEFRWMDEPRPARVETFLSSLKDNVAELGRQAFLNNTLLAVTIADENQVTQFELLKTYIQMLELAWNQYLSVGRSGQPSALSERIDRARVLLPVVAQGTTDFSNALESVGLSESERRSRASRFSTLAVPSITRSGLAETNNPRPTNLGQWLPDMTVNDLIDWLYRFANPESSGPLDDIYGINFVTDQADRLFWTIAPIVAHLKTRVPLNASSQSMLEQLLSNERVTWALDNLLTQLNELANVAV